MSKEFSVVAESTKEKLGTDEALGMRHHRKPPARIEDLERENVRLQLLVAELLIKNQQLRRAEKPD